MSIKLKIILFISVLVILSLGATLFYLSYKEYKPSLKNEIIQRIDYQLNYLIPTTVKLLDPDLLPDEVKRNPQKMEDFKFSFKIENERILNNNKEVLFLNILKGQTSKNLRYFACYAKNMIVYKLKNSDREIEYINRTIDKLKRKKVKDSRDLIAIAGSKTNNSFSTNIYLYKTFSIKQFFKDEEQRYNTHISNIKSLVLTNIKKIRSKEYARKSKRRKLYRVFSFQKRKSIKMIEKFYNESIDTYHTVNRLLKKIENKPKIKLIYESSEKIEESDLKELKKLLDSEKKKKRLIRTSKQFLKEVRSLQKIKRLLSKIKSRITFINKILNENFDELCEYTYKFTNLTKEQSDLINLNIIKFYKEIPNYGIYEVGISEEKIMKTINKIIKRGINSSLIILIISIAGALLLSLYIIFPIHILDKGADEILKDLKYRIKLKRKDEFGKFAQTFNNLADQLIEELSKYQKLYKEATEDALTKLMVRRYFMETLRRELENAQKERRSTSLLMTDIDHFKKFNDTYGHQTGDIVLAKVAEVLLKNTRRNRVRNDVAGRYGGEEFTVLLPATEKEEALKVAERIRKEVENMLVKSAKGENLKVTISIGVATSEDSNIEPEKLIERADKALYHSKETGRNKVSYG